MILYYDKTIGFDNVYYVKNDFNPDVVKIIPFKSFFKFKLAI